MRCRPLWLAGVLFGLVGCGRDAPPEAAVAGGPQRIVAPPPPEALPDCERVAAALGALVQGMDVVDPAGTAQDDPDSYGRSCAWRAAADGAALGAIVLVDRQPLTATEMQRAGMYVEDPRAAALDGFIAMPDAMFDGDAALGPVGPQVIAGAVTVTIAGNGRGRAADVTLDQAVDAAVAVHRLMR